MDETRKTYALSDSDWYGLKGFIDEVTFRLSTGAYGPSDASRDIMSALKVWDQGTVPIMQEIERLRWRWEETGPSPYQSNPYNR